MVITVVSKTSIGSSILSLPAMKENIYLKSNGTLFETGYNRIGKYYISPYLLKDFKDPEQLFPY